MVPVNGARFYGHRTVKKNLPPIQLPLSGIFGKNIKQFLASTDSKGRDKNVAPFIPGILQNASDFLKRFVPFPVQTVSIRTLDDHGISLFYERGIIQNRGIILAEISAENKSTSNTVFVQHKDNNRRTENMTGIVKRDGNARQNLLLSLIWQRHHAVDRLDSVLHAIERLYGVKFLFSTFPVFVSSILLTQTGRILQQHKREVSGSLLRKHRAPEPLFDKKRKTA